MGHANTQTVRPGRTATIGPTVFSRPPRACAGPCSLCPRLSFPPIRRAASLALAYCTRDNLAQFTKPQHRACDGRAEEADPPRPGGGGGGLLPQRGEQNKK